MVLVVQACAASLTPRQLLEREPPGRVAFVVAPRGWDGTPAWAGDAYRLAPHECSGCGAQQQPGRIVSVSYRPYRSFAAPFEIDLKALATRRGSDGAAEALGQPVLTEGTEHLDALSKNAVFRYGVGLGGGSPFLGTADEPEADVLRAMSAEGISSVIVLSMIGITLYRDDRVGASFDLRVFDTRTATLVHHVKAGAPWEIAAGVTAPFFPTGVEDDAPDLTEVARRYRRACHPEPAQLARLEQQIGAVVKQFVAADLSGTPWWQADSDAFVDGRDSARVSPVAATTATR
jgi:hypothetical protein